MKKSLSILFVLALIVTALVPSVGFAGAKAAGRVVVYTSVPTNQLNLMVDMFHDQYPGITVDVISAKQDVLISRVRQEASAPNADVLIGGGLDDYGQVADLFEVYESENAGAIYDSYLVSDAFTPIQLHVSALVVNNALAKKLGVVVNGWDSLSDEKLAGHVAYMDPAATSPDAQQSDFVKAMAEAAHIASPSAPSFVLNAVHAGQYAVGIINEEKAIERKVAGADIDLVYAKEGAAVGLSYAGIISGSANQANARLFLDFLTSKDYQQAAAKQLYQRSVRTDVDFSAKGVLPTAKLVALDYSAYMLKLNAQNARVTGAR